MSIPTPPPDNIPPRNIPPHEMEKSLPQPPDEVIDFLERLGEVLAAQVLYGSGKDEAAQALLDDKTWTP